MRVKEYMIAFLVLETLMVGVFCALDLVLFYLFFEGGLIPMFLIIGIWGGKRRVYASFKFFLYTLLGSVLMLLAIMAMYGMAGTTDITVLLQTHFPVDDAEWLWLAFFASFAVKMPMWPVHTWLPDAHVEAPTAGSVILAGILLKMGGYGFIRFSLPMFPDASAYFAPLVFALSIIAIIYTSLVALVQEDMKKLIAYSSVAHMGFVTMGIFTHDPAGRRRARIFQMISHGLVSGALFLCVGVVYDRMHTREIAAYGGLVERMPLYARGFHGVHAGQCRPARHVGLHRRVPDFARRVPGQHLGRVLRDHRHDPVGLLRALPLSPHHIRRHRQAEPAGHPRSFAARDRDHGAACPLTILLRRAPDAGPRCLTAAPVEAAHQGLRRQRSASHARRPRSADTPRLRAMTAFVLRPRALPARSFCWRSARLCCSCLALSAASAPAGSSPRSPSVSSALAIARVICWRQGKRRDVFDGAFIDDAFARFMKVLALLGSLVTLVMSQDYMRRERIEQFEFPVLVLLSTLGMLMLISANGLIALYLGLELM